MALFGSDSSTSNPSTTMAKKDSIQDQLNLVGEGTTFEGTLEAQSDVRASGRIVGTLDVTGKAIVAESGTVEGEIIATNADIAGRVQGEIRVKERLVLKSTARVDGNIQTDRLVVEEGALFTGECEMGEPVSTNGQAGDEASESGGPSGAPASGKGPKGKSSKGKSSKKASSAAPGSGAKKEDSTSTSAPKGSKKGASDDGS
jgi:cytoskeletal protein CcmA (bactofilin family)